MNKVLFLLGLFMPLAGVCQKIENLKAVSEGNKIIITFDISGGVTGDSYDVSLYASYNNYSSPLKLTSGEVGKGVTEGKGKRIEWDAKAELVDYKGELSFEVRVEVIAAFTLLNRVISAKRGKTVQVSWRGGNKNKDVKIELLKAGTVAGVISTVSNEGSFQWVVSPKQQTGKDFQLRLVNGGEIITTEQFTIHNKFSTAVKVLPAALLVLLILPSSQSSPTSTSRSLPVPPSLTLN